MCAEVKVTNYLYSRNYSPFELGRCNGDDYNDDGNNNNKKKNKNNKASRRVLKEKWENKLMHGQYIRSMDRQLISEEDTFIWLSRGDLNGETGSEIIAAQDLVPSQPNEVYIHLCTRHPEAIRKIEE
jgi:hypothetical protein